MIEKVPTEPTPLKIRAPPKAGSQYADVDTDDAVARQRKARELRPVWFLPNVDDKEGMFEKTDKAEKSRAALPTSEGSARWDKIAQDVEAKHTEVDTERNAYAAHEGERNETEAR